MAYIGLQKQDVLILNAVKHHHDVSRQSFRGIMLSVNNFRVSKGLPAYSFDQIEAHAKSITRFYNGNNIRGEGLKRDLFDYYVHEKFIILDDNFDDFEMFALAADNFFKQNEKIKSDITHLCGRYYGYKRAIRDPEVLGIKFLMVLEKSDVATNTLCIRETHVNRTFKPGHANVVQENWSGLLLRRAQANYFGLVREDLLGTPHSYTMHSTQSDTDGKLVLQFFGESIEIVENWGKTSTLESRIVFERQPDDVPEAILLEQCDLVFVETLKSERKDIVNYIWGSK